jgi:hypothetical protein
MSLMILLLLTLACTLEEPADNPQVANAKTATPDPTRGPVLPMPTSVPLEGVTVSLFENELPPGKTKTKGKKAPKKYCRWSRVDQELKRRRLATFPRTCGAVVQVSWYPDDADHAVVKLEDTWWDVNQGEVTKLPNRPPEDTEFGVTTDKLHPGLSGIEGLPADEASAKAATAHLHDGAEAGDWQMATTDDGKVVWWQTEAGPSLPVLVASGDTWEALTTDTYRAPEGVTISYEAPYLLVTSMGSLPVVFDMKTDKVVLKSKTAVGVMFWPFGD